MIFSWLEIPEILQSDNGPQYASKEFEELAKSYGFWHETSSPLYPKSNGLAECMVQTAKRLLSRSADPQLALQHCCPGVISLLLSCWWEEVSEPLFPKSALTWSPSGATLKNSMRKIGTSRGSRRETMTVTTGQVRCLIFQRTQLYGYSQETSPRREALLLMLANLDHTLWILQQGDYRRIGLTSKWSQITNLKRLNYIES